MTTLNHAWEWYAAVRAGVGQLSHLSKYWDELPWDQEAEWVARLERDNVLSTVGATAMAAGALLIRNELDDLAVLVLFSVFEAIVRDWIEVRVKPEVEALRDPTLIKAGQDVLDAVAQGSFSRLLEPYKSTASSDLVEHVNQVRRYRNWVAHGRRPDKKPGALVRPREAYERLTEFLDAIRPPAPQAQPTDA